MLVEGSTLTDENQSWARSRRSFHELLHPDDALTLVHQWVAASPHQVQVLPCDANDGQRTLEALQISTRSPLGAIGHQTGGLLLDRGWLRILGAGSVRLPRSLDGWNRLGVFDRCAHGLLVAVALRRARQRKAVPMDELWDYQMDLADQLAGR